MHPSVDKAAARFDLPSEVTARQAEIDQKLGRIIRDVCIPLENKRAALQQLQTDLPAERAALEAVLAPEIDRLLQDSAGAIKAEYLQEIQKQLTRSWPYRPGPKAAQLEFEPGGLQLDDLDTDTPVNELSGELRLRLTFRSGKHLPVRIPASEADQYFSGVEAGAPARAFARYFRQRGGIVVPYRERNTGSHAPWRYHFLSYHNGARALRIRSQVEQQQRRGVAGNAAAALEDSQPGILARYECLTALERRQHYLRREIELLQRDSRPWRDQPQLQQQRRLLDTGLEISRGEAEYGFVKRSGKYSKDSRKPGGHGEWNLRVGDQRIYQITENGGLRIPITTAKDRPFAMRVFNSFSRPLQTARSLFAAQPGEFITEQGVLVTGPAAAAARSFFDKVERSKSIIVLEQRTGRGRILIEIGDLQKQPQRERGSGPAVDRSRNWGQKFLNASNHEKEEPSAIFPGEESLAYFYPSYVIVESNLKARATYVFERARYDELCGRRLRRSEFPGQPGFAAAIAHAAGSDQEGAWQAEVGKYMC